MSSIVYSCGFIEDAKNIIPLISDKKYKIIETIKSSINKIIYKVLNKEDNMFYTIKVKYKDTVSESEIEIYKILKKNNPKFLKNLEKVLITDNFLIILSKFIKGKNLLQIKNGEIKNKSVKNKIIKKMIEVIKFFENNSIIHGNINPGNVLISENEEIFLIDCDDSKFLNDLDEKYETKNFFSAPEVIENEKLTKQTDIWGLGVIITYLELEELSKIILEDYFDNFYQITKNEYYSINNDFINKMLDEKPNNRPKINEIEKYFFEIERTDENLSKE